VLAIANILRRYRFYHFHDTSAEAGIRRSGYIEDAYSLRSDAGNLAAFLYGLKCRTEMEPYYRRIENTIRLAFPQFREFVLAPRVENKEYIRLNWYSRASEDYLLGPHQLSDGALRFAALATLLLQPPDRLPALIVLDEPELGLHPVAIALLAEMIKGVALQQAQVLVATQSPQLVDQFDLGRIRPIEHRSGRSVILELDPEAYKDWLDEYSTGELWEKNIIGGGPTGG
jgi:predicted ATPase